MSPDEINVHDVIICVQEYPEDGDQAQVVFVNYTALQADKSIGCRDYAKYIAHALKNGKRTSGGSDYAITFGNSDAEKYAVNPPCMVTDAVTIYF